MKTYNIGFNGNDETQFDAESMEELLELFAITIDGQEFPVFQYDITEHSNEFWYN